MTENDYNLLLTLSFNPRSAHGSEVVAEQHLVLLDIEIQTYLWGGGGGGGGEKTQGARGYNLD